MDIALLNRGWNRTWSDTMVNLEARKLVETANRLSAFYLQDGLTRIKFVEEIKQVVDKEFETARRAKTDEECIAAAKRANAHDFIMLLPDGYETVLEGDGSGLSQGQRQLLSIARAAVADPPVMILDEATSSIDTRTERIVQAGMDALMKGRTVFVIAHRLSTITHADYIFVLEEGKLIESGTAEELQRKNGVFQKMWDAYQTSVQWKVSKEGQTL
mgnify:CR=1 FL=1